MMFTREVCVGFAVLVTESFRKKLSSANFGELQFRPTIKKHIVSIPWHTWDRNARLPWEAEVPGERPEEGEPENYISGQRHSPEAAAEMEDIWEFSAPVVSCKVQGPRGFSSHQWRLSALADPHGRLFRPPSKGHVLFVDEGGRDWFERETDGWVDFDETIVV
jgi:hypothetical protein